MGAGYAHNSGELGERDMTLQPGDIILSIGRYFINLFIALDQTANAIFLGDPDETISSRLGRNYPNSVMTRVVNILFFWDKNHCKENIEPESNTDDAIVR